MSKVKWIRPESPHVDNFIPEKEPALNPYIWCQHLQIQEPALTLLSASNSPGGLTVSGSAMPVNIAPKLYWVPKGSLLEEVGTTIFGM